MPDVLAGIRVVEVAAWTFVPISGAVLAEWGADVIKIEHPVSGDPQRGLVSSGLVPGGDGVNFMFEVPNRGKRNDSRSLSYVVSQIAQIKGITEEEVEQITTENALRLYPRLRV